MTLTMRYSSSTKKTNLKIQKSTTTKENFEIIKNIKGMDHERTNRLNYCFVYDGDILTCEEEVKKVLK